MERTHHWLLGLGDDASVMFLVQDDISHKSSEWSDLVWRAAGLTMFLSDVIVPNVLFEPLL